MEASTNMEEDPRVVEEDSTAIRVEDLEEPSTQMVWVTSTINNMKGVTTALSQPVKAASKTGMTNHIIRTKAGDSQLVKSNQ